VVSSNPAVPALQIATGHLHACALTFDTSLVDLQHLTLKSDTPASNAAFLESVTPVCWGASGLHSNNNLSPPAIGDAAAGDPIVSVRTGDGFTCVRTFKGRVQCSGEYGNLEGPAEDRVPQGVLFSALTVGQKHVVAIEAGTAKLRAWGDCSSLNECTPPTGVSFAGAEGSLSAGRMFTCALDTGLRPHCWGRVFWPRATPVTSEFIEINSGMTHTCGIRRNDTRATCWGECSFGEYVGGGSWEGVLSVARGLCARWAAAPRLFLDAVTGRGPCRALFCRTDTDLKLGSLLPCRLLLLTLLAVSPPSSVSPPLHIRCDPPLEFNRIPCERHAPRGTCLRSVSSGVCASRACGAGYTWRFDAPCGCYYKFASISVPVAGATIGGGPGGTTECRTRAGVPFFFLDKKDPTNQAPRCLG